MLTLSYMYVGIYIPCFVLPLLKITGLCGTLQGGMWPEMFEVASTYL